MERGRQNGRRVAPMFSDAAPMLPEDAGGFRKRFAFFVFVQLNHLCFSGMSRMVFFSKSASLVVCVKTK